MSKIALTKDTQKDVLELFDRYGEEPVCRTSNTKWGLPVDELNIESWNKIREVLSQPTIEELRNSIIERLQELYIDKSVRVVYMPKSFKFLITNERGWNKEIGINCKNQLYYNLPLPLQLARDICEYFIRVGGEKDE